MSLMSRSFPRSRGPVLYHPSTRSLAATGEGHPSHQVAGLRLVPMHLKSAAAHTAAHQNQHTTGGFLSLAVKQRAARQQPCRRTAGASTAGPNCPAGPQLQTATAVLTVDFFEHCAHALHVAVVQEPNPGIAVILLKRHCTAGSGGQQSEQAQHRKCRLKPPVLGIVAARLLQGDGSMVHCLQPQSAGQRKKPHDALWPACSSCRGSLCLQPQRQQHMCLHGRCMAPNAQSGRPAPP